MRSQWVIEFGALEESWRMLLSHEVGTHGSFLPWSPCVRHSSSNIDLPFYLFSFLSLIFPFCLPFTLSFLFFFLHLSSSPLFWLSFSSCFGTPLATPAGNPQSPPRYVPGSLFKYYRDFYKYAKFEVIYEIWFFVNHSSSHWLDPENPFAYVTNFNVANRSILYFTVTGFIPISTQSASGLRKTYVILKVVAIFVPRIDPNMSHFKANNYQSYWTRRLY